MVEVKNKPPLDSETSVKETFKSLSRKNKIQFIYDYYKFPKSILGVSVLTILQFIYLWTFRRFLQFSQVGIGRVCF